MSLINGGERMNKEEAFDHFIARFKEIDTRPYYKVNNPYWWECYYEIEDLLNECLEEVENAD